MTSIRRGIGILTCVVVASLAGAAVPVLAATPSPVDEPPVGRHVLIDEQEFPGADCRTSSGDLQSIRVRRPVMYARNRTDGVDHQTVGWRWQLRDGSFALVDQGPIEQTDATDRRPAAFLNQNVDMAGRPDGPWFISIRMFWYKPGSSSVIQGKARHFVRTYGLNNQSVFGTDSGCVGGIAIVLPPPPGHSGDFGIHVLLDDGHATPVICTYGGGSTGLVKVQVRQPIMLAFNSGPGTQSQDVRWRFVVEATDEFVPDKDTVWIQLSPGVPFVNANASERRPAGFGARSRPITVSERGHANYRVQVVMNWLRSNGSVDGSAVHTAARYALVTGDGSSAGVVSLCAGGAPT